MFVGIARLTLNIPASGSLKDKRQIVRKILDRARAKFNVAAAEVDANDLWQKAVLGFTVVGNDRRFVSESLDNVLHFVEELYLAPIVDRQTEVLSMGDGFGETSVGQGGLRIDSGNRTLADAEKDWAAEALEEWEKEEP